jgi:pyruvate kinase
MKTKTLESLRKKIRSLIEQCHKISLQNAQNLEQIHPKYRLSAQNLLHYQNLRGQDLRKIQRELGYLGLSRLAKSAPHVLPSLLSCERVLSALLGQNNPKAKEPDIKTGKKTLNLNTKALLGQKRKHRTVRIMVTMPTEAAEDAAWAETMIKAGMDCARINCAHDNAEIWKKMASNIRQASQKLNRPCLICVDLCGPKVRTGALAKGAEVLRLSPERDELGAVLMPASVWISVAPEPHSEPIPELPWVIEQAHWQKLPEKFSVYFHDSRGKRRTLWIEAKTQSGALAHCYDSAYITTGTPIFSALGEIIAHVGQLPALEQKLILCKGDTLLLHSEPIEGEPGKPAHISCTAKEVFRDAKPGEIVKFDDGKIGGMIKKIENQTMEIEITYAKEGGTALGSDKGINFPQTQLNMEGLTLRDKEDLAQAVEYADFVSLSFVNKPQDIEALQNQLAALNKTQVGIVLKIETKNGFNRLTPLLLQAMKTHPVGVMIARGDLAVECGWEQMAYIQEEILSICQAAHLPAIWATQVLENLAKKGIPSRAEITDAAMSNRADCVMLNKGPYLLEAIKTLDAILTKMKRYQSRNESLLPSFQTLE